MITPRSLTQGRSPELQPLENAGYELIFARPGQTPTEDELLELVPGCRGWLAGVEPISERVLQAATGLQAASDDILSLHCPPAPGGQPVIGREALSRIKDGCCPEKKVSSQGQGRLTCLRRGRVIGHATAQESGPD